MAVLGSNKFFVKLLVSLCLILVLGSKQAEAGNGTSGDGSSEERDPKCDVTGTCKDGVIIPMWLPQENLSSGDKAARAIVYLSTLAFMFLGISIISDRFMASIEVITSKEREVTIRRPDGETTVMTVRVWNETVSNLTLMALGSSAPEIMLSVIEICGNRFEAGDLGPGTIVGSAAFNLFVIIGLCCYVIPDGEVRRIKHLRVFFITAFLSVFAYLWMYIIIAVSSYGVIDIWEGIVTLLFFPLTVMIAYFADRRIFMFKFLQKRYRTTAHKTIAAFEGDVEMADKHNHVGDEITFKGLDSDDAEIREFEKHRKEYIEILREIRKKHPNITDMKTLEEMAEIEAMNRGPKSRAFYRIQATRKLTGGGNVVKKAKQQIKSDTHDVNLVCTEDDMITRIFFEPGHYTVMENVGIFQCTVTRQGGNLNNTVYVDYRTEDGTANAGSDYEYAEGTLVFQPGESHNQFPITIIDDDIFEEDEHFYVRLSNIRVGNTDGMFTDEDHSQTVQLANPSMATVMILDDDHAGIFHFESAEISFPESIGEAQVKVVRSSGARGTVKVPFRTMEGTAKGNGKDFVDVEGCLEFHDDETEAFVKVRIVDDEEYEKNEVFYIELDEPQLYKSTSGERVEFSNKPEDEMTEEERIAELGRPRLGEPIKIACHIRESMEFKSTVDKLLMKANVSIAVGTSSWREQFIDAITVSAGHFTSICVLIPYLFIFNYTQGIIMLTLIRFGDDEGDDDDEGEEKLPSCMDYVMHFLTIFWKVLFAFVPPTDYWGGWAAFLVSISLIGLLTAFVGDTASHFGCTVGLKDTVTSITFVALGTSLPDYWGGWLCFWVSIIVIGGLTGFVGDIASSFGCTVGMKDSVTAITFVALGTSLPDTFASKVAAVGDEYADASIGNVTGSNAVNVFLGIGVAWSVAAIYHAAKGEKFRVEPGSLAFSVTIFCVCAFVAIAIMLIRRRPFSGGELGGPRSWKIATSTFFFILWSIYIILSSLEAYCHIKGF